MEKERIIDILEKESEFEKVSATYLFYGDKRVDLIYYAKEFCKLILLKNKQSTEDEEYIMRQINDESHPDIEIINKDNSGIKIDKVREIIYSAIESPYNSSKKIFIINGVEGLRKESANAFLKIIEEPPKDIYFILLTRTLNILPTIKSRAIKFYIPAQTPVSLNVEKETYDFFDGNTEKIEKWKKSNVNINDKKNVKFKETLDIIRKYDYMEKLVDLFKKINSSDQSVSIEKTELKELKELLKSISNFHEIEFLSGYDKLKQKDFTYEKLKELGEFIETNEIRFYSDFINAQDFIIRKISVMSVEEYYELLYEIDTIYKQKKDKLLDLLSKITVKVTKQIDETRLMKLISIKNSLRSNVNPRSVIFNFFEVLRN